MIPAQPQIDSDGREDDGDQSAVELGGIGANEVLVLDELEQCDEKATGCAV